MSELSFSWRRCSKDGRAGREEGLEDEEDEEVGAVCSCVCVDVQMRYDIT